MQKCVTIKSFEVMTNKQRKLLDAIMDEFYRIDRRDNFLYYRMSSNIDIALEYYSMRLDDCETIDELDVIRNFHVKRIEDLIEKRKAAKLSKFLRECPFSSDFKVALRDIYVKTRNGEPFYIDYDFDTIKLRLVLWYLSKF